MKVKDIIDAHVDFSFAKDTEINFIVKPKGTTEVYFNSECHWWKNSPEVTEMDVKHWMICDARKNKCKFIIIVERDEEYEKKKRQHWETTTT